MAAEKRRGWKESEGRLTGVASQRTDAIDHFLSLILLILFILSKNASALEELVPPLTAPKLDTPGVAFILGRPVSHQDTYYRQNEAYAEFLANWDAAFYAKYTDALRPRRPGGRVLDVGCGVGQVIGKLCADGIDAYGAEISEPNVARARKVCPNAQVYDGRRLPFPDAHFNAVGTLNVLEHVDEPEAYLAELVRVAEPGATVVVSSPNFLRAFGPGYHPRMKGLGQKWRNLQALLARRRELRARPDAVRFERMPPIVRQPFQPDDDAIVATHSLDIAFFLQRLGCVVERVECTDRYVPAPLDWALNATPLKWCMFNAFVVARRR